MGRQKKEKEDLNDEIAKIRPELLALRREVSRLREEMDTRARIIKELEAEVRFITINLCIHACGSRTNILVSL